MSDYRFDHTAPLHALKRGLMGSGDHPLSDGRLSALMGGSFLKQQQSITKKNMPRKRTERVQRVGSRR